jgi:DNA-binding transcriptional MerR regulator
MFVLDFFVVNVALPDIQRGLGAGSAAIEWIVAGDFSRMTHLSVKALRHYHDVGVLEPAAIDQYTGYRSYHAAQVPAAQIIRRLRDLGMPLDGIAAVLSAPDVETRNKEIAGHLARMERQLAETQASVASLRALLTVPVPHPAVDYRTIPAVTALAIAETVEGCMEWITGALGELTSALAASGRERAGCFGGLYPGDFFELERAEVTVFIPVTGGGQWRHGRAHLTEIPAVDAAIAVHEGRLEDADRTYAALGTAVAQRAIGVDGSIREYYPVSFLDTADEGEFRTEICWPVFRTAN